MDTLQSDENPTVHSDRGCHYRWPGWIQRMDEAGLTRSMSKKGCTGDNAACEGFFGRKKKRCFTIRIGQESTYLNSCRSLMIIFLGIMKSVLKRHWEILVL